MENWLIQYQGYLSGIVTVLLTIILGVIIRANRKRRRNENEQIEHLKGLLAYQKKHTDETSELNKTIKGMDKEIKLARVDSRSAIEALMRGSNGIKFDKYILEARERLMQDLKFKYED